MIKLNTSHVNKADFTEPFITKIRGHQKKFAQTAATDLNARSTAKSTDESKKITPVIHWKDFLALNHTGILWQNLVELTEENLLTILQIPYPSPEYNAVLTSFPGIRAYLNLDDTYSDIAQYDTEKLPDQLPDRLRTNVLVSEAWSAIHPNVSISQSSPEELLSLAQNLLTYLNEMVDRIISYDFMDTEQRAELLRQMGVRVCPYCNQQYVYPIRWKKPDEHTNESAVLGDMDHHLPKSIYGIFALSLWNMVPSCKSCNSVMKGTDMRKLLNPHLEGFGRNCRFRINNLADIDYLLGNTKTQIQGKWTINPEVQDNKKKERIQNNIDLFELDALYNIHQAEIKDILLKKSIYTESYKNDLRTLLGEKIPLDDDTLNRILYGSTLNPAKAAEEPHAKLVSDLLC